VWGLFRGPVPRGPPVPGFVRYLNTSVLVTEVARSHSRCLDSASCAVLRLNATARRASSSRPSTAIGTARSSVRAMCSADWVRASTGRVRRRANSAPRPITAQGVSAVVSAKKADELDLGPGQDLARMGEQQLQEGEISAGELESDIGAHHPTGDLVEAEVRECQARRPARLGLGPAQQRRAQRRATSSARCCRCRDGSRCHRRSPPISFNATPTRAFMPRTGTTRCRSPEPSTAIRT